MKTKIKAFSLLELLLAVSLLAVLGSTLFNFFGNAKTTYKRLQGLIKNSEPFEQIQKVFQNDLSRLLVFQNVSLVGAANSLYFHQGKMEAMGGISRVDYRLSQQYDAIGSYFNLERVERPYPYLLETDTPEQTKCILFEKAEKITFSFLAKLTPIQETSQESQNTSDSSKKEDTPELTSWFPFWKITQTPVAVSLSIRTRENKSWEAIFWISQSRGLDFSNLPSVPLSTVEEDQTQ